jgi:hypothetical protein
MVGIYIPEIQVGIYQPYKQPYQEQVVACYVIVFLNTICEIFNNWIMILPSTMGTPLTSPDVILFTILMGDESAFFSLVCVVGRGQPALNPQFTLPFPQISL